MRQLVAIGAFLVIAGFFYVASNPQRDDGEPERERHEVVPLGNPTAAPVEEAFPMPPPYDPNEPLPPPPTMEDEVDPEERERADMERLIETLSGGEQDIQEEEVREAFEAVPDEELRPEPREDPEATARRRRSMRVRRQQSLELVDLLISELTPELETARAEGDVERVGWLEASQRRLGVRRASLERAIAEIDAAEEVDRAIGAN